MADVRRSNGHVSADAWWSGWEVAIAPPHHPAGPDIGLVVHMIEVVGSNHRRCVDSRLVLRHDRRLDELVWDEGRMRLHAVSTWSGVHKTPAKIMETLVNNSLQTGSMMTLLFLPEKFRCRSEVEFMDAKFLSVEIMSLATAS